MEPTCLPLHQEIIVNELQVYQCYKRNAGRSIMSTKIKEQEMKQSKKLWHIIGAKDYMRMRDSETEIYTQVVARYQM